MVSPQAHYSTGRVSASFTSTAMVPETTHEAGSNWPHTLSVVARHGRPPHPPRLCGLAGSSPAVRWGCALSKVGLCLGGQHLSGGSLGGLPHLGHSALLCWPWLVRAHRPPAPPPLPLLAPGARPPPGPLTRGRRAAQASPRSGHRRGRAALPVCEEEGLRASAHQPGRPQPGAALRPGVWVPPQLRAASGAQARCLHQPRAWLWAPGALPAIEAAVCLTGALGLFQTPKTCENFIKLCKKQYYNGTVFHRSIRNFVVSWLPRTRVRGPPHGGC